MDYAFRDSKSLEKLEAWAEAPARGEQPQTKRGSKKRRKPLRRNRKPSRPANYIGQRTNNRLNRL